MSNKNLCWIVPGFQACLISSPYVTAQVRVGSYMVFVRVAIVSEVNLVKA